MEFRELNPIDTDRIMRESLNSCMKELAKPLNLKSISISEKTMQISDGEKIFYVQCSWMSAKTIGTCIHEIATTGKCTYPHTIRYLVRE